MGTNKLQRLAPAWHAEAKHMLQENFARIHSLFTDATKRAVWMGMFLNHLKQRGKDDKSIPHGEFGPWLEKNCPEVPWRTANTYMKLADGVCEKSNFQIRQFSEFAGGGKLPPTLEKIIEGKTQQQLFLEFKNVDKDGNPKGAGREPGCDGTKPKLSLSEEVALRQKLATKQWNALAKLATVYQDKFTVLTDHEVEAQIATLEQALTARRAWLKQPLNRREPKLIAEMFA